MGPPVYRANFQNRKTKQGYHSKLRRLTGLNRLLFGPVVVVSLFLNRRNEPFSLSLLLLRVSECCCVLSCF